MPYERFRMTCQRVRAIGAVTEVFLDRDASYPQVLANLPLAFGNFEEGKQYWVTIEPAFPHER